MKCVLCGVQNYYTNRNYCMYGCLSTVKCYICGVYLRETCSGYRIAGKFYCNRGCELMHKTMCKI
jgi:hypothetical protein